MDESTTAFMSLIMVVGLIVGIIDRLGLGKKISELQQEAIDKGYAKWEVDKHGGTEFKFIVPEGYEEESS